MAQSADTYLEATRHHGTTKKMDDIRWTDEEKDKIRQEFLICFAIAKRAQRITDNQEANPTFDTVEELMKLLMGLEEQKEEARDEMCYFLQYQLDYIYNRRFYDEITNIRDITDVAVERSIAKAKEFLQNIDDIDGTFALHQNDFNEIIDSIRYYTEQNGKRGPGTLTVLVDENHPVRHRLRKFNGFP